MVTVLAGCGLPPALAPIPPVPFSTQELQEATARWPPALAEDVVLRGVRGDTVRGRADVNLYLAGDERFHLHSVQVESASVYRCGPDRAGQVGTYSMILENAGGLDELAGGQWRGEWQRDAQGRWSIQAASFDGPVAAPATAPEECVTEAEDRFARARLSFSGHMSAAGIQDGTSHDALGRSGAVTRFGGSAGIRYRFPYGLALGGYLGTLPGYSSTQPGGREDKLTSSGSYRALVVGYEARNIVLEAGPAWVATEWLWRDGDTNRPEEDISFQRRGYVASAHLLFQVFRQLSVDLLVQQRWFGQDTALPRLDPELAGEQDHLYIGIGAAVFPWR